MHPALPWLFPPRGFFAGFLSRFCFSFVRDKNSTFTETFVQESLKDTEPLNLEEMLCPPCLEQGNSKRSKHGSL